MKRYYECHFCHRPVEKHDCAELEMEEQVGIIGMMVGAQSKDTITVYICTDCIARRRNGHIHEPDPVIKRVEGFEQ